MHPWHGKSKQERKEYIEQLLIKFKTGRMKKEGMENQKLLDDLQSKTPKSPIRTAKSAGATRHHNT